MPLEIEIGDLVDSTHFTGLGKVLAILSELEEIRVGFFESPLNPEARVVQLPIPSVRQAQLYEEAIVYCRDFESQIWLRARYGGSRPDNTHLLIVRKNEYLELPIAEIYSLNLGQHGRFRPADFLASQANDAPYYFPFRDHFVTAYLEQRAACRSISAIPSSSVEIEPHQIAVVRRVLLDPIPKYILADEVGLGKTIEAGLIIREHLLEKKRLGKVIVTVPDALVEQWRQELTMRFHLGELLDSENDSNPLLLICAHKDLAKVIQTQGFPTLIAVDEAHHISPFAWSSEENEYALFGTYAEAIQTADVALLLSGTPLNGNEKNFLAMLHCFNPDAYSLSEEGITHFMMRISERERLGGLYSALTVNSSNSTIDGILDELLMLFPKDSNLVAKIDNVRPHVDFFSKEEGEERSKVINDLRKYIGDHYRLHQRMLRNRRENSGLAVLFPGLAGLCRKEWLVDNKMLTIDELLEEYRSLAMDDPEAFFAMGPKQYLDWVDDLLICPLRVGQRAEHLLISASESFLQEEQDILQQLVETAKIEQEAKDNALIEALEVWLHANPNGKAVLFCGEQEIASYVFEKLVNKFYENVEQYTPSETPKFCFPDSNIRILVSDQRGEDGLNLHGGRRLAVHYSLTRSFSRIEQRLGRLNRYSANLKGVKPVESLVILPARSGLTSQWISLLDDAVGLFNSTAASLQYMLEEHLEQTWKEVIHRGVIALDESICQLKGEYGLLAKERKKVKAQEALLAMDEEVSQAAEFADQMAEADRRAEQQANWMAGWITQALQFKQLGDFNNVFRFAFQSNSDNGAQTLVDVRTFISTCLTGIDMDSGYPPSTMPMSVLRSRVAGQEEVYPFRYGQPFIDAIWDLLQTDSRGASTAILRFVENVSLPEPRLFFRLKWLVSMTPPGANHIQQRCGDDHMPPQVFQQWLREDGRLVDPELEKFLDMPYDKSARNYRDLNLRTHVWHDLSPWLPLEKWQKIVLAIEEHGRNRVQEELNLKGNISFNPHFQLLSMCAILLCGPDTFSSDKP